MRRVAKEPGSPRFIDSIFNYCDQWCERCPLTARCRVYATEQQTKSNDASRDIQNAAFWEHLGEQLQAAQRMLREMAAEHGIDLDAVDVEAADVDRRRRIMQAKSRELARSARQYANLAEKWFKAAKPLFEEKQVSLESHASMALPGHDPANEAQEIRDAVEVIRWYQHQVEVKLTRAMHQDDEDDEHAQYDRDGSAKVALIGMDRSVSGWLVLRRHFTEQADAILSLLLRLDELRRRTETAFPGARTFRRPGFDDARSSLEYGEERGTRSP
jgi:hypothetical protein